MNIAFQKQIETRKESKKALQENESSEYNSTGKVDWKQQVQCQNGVNPFIFENYEWDNIAAIIPRFSFHLES